LLDGAVVNPVPVAATIDDATDLTVAVDLSGPVESRPVPPISASLISDNRYRQRILKFVEAVRPPRGPRESSRGLVDVAFTSMQTMQDTIARLRLSAYPPDVLVQLPRNAYGLFEFWRAEELIEIGRDCAARAFAREGPQGR
jgi:NTE family protein